MTDNPLKPSQPDPINPLPRPPMPGQPPPPPPIPAAKRPDPSKHKGRQDVEAHEEWLKGPNGDGRGGSKP